jgi:hypothetical protein
MAIICNYCSNMTEERAYVPAWQKRAANTFFHHGRLATGSTLVKQR